MNANVEMLRSGYAAWDASKGADKETWLRILADDMCLWSICNGAPGAEFTAECGCKEEAARYMSQLTEAWDMEFYRIDEFVSEGDRVVAIGRTAWTNKATGKRMETPKVDIWRFRDGKAISFAEYYDSAGLLAAAV